MMKYLRFFILSLVLSMPSLISASTVYFSPSVATVTAGQSFTVTLVVDPQGTAYTAKIAASFPANLLSVVSFSHAPGWLPLSQPGYDSVDNSSGSLIKTAGLSGGFSSPKVFGSITFVAKGSGTANINIAGGTEILNSSNQNTFTGGGQATVNIGSPNIVPAPSPAQTPKSNSTPANPKRYLMNNSPTSTVASSHNVTSATETPATSTELGASAVSLRNLPVALNVLIPLLALLGGFFLGRYGKA